MGFRVAGTSVDLEAPGASVVSPVTVTIGPDEPTDPSPGDVWIDTE